jgi:hypothetical protein
MIAALRIRPSVPLAERAILRRYHAQANSPMPQAVALVTSIAIEAVVAFALIRALRWGRGGNAALAAALGTVVTHPIVWVLVPRLETPLGYAGSVALIESGVVLAESVAYRMIVPLAWRRALAASLVANAASTAAGLLYYTLAD